MEQPNIDILREIVFYTVFNYLKILRPYDGIDLIIQMTNDLVDKHLTIK